MDQSSSGGVAPIAPEEIVVTTILAVEQPCIICGYPAERLMVTCESAACLNTFNKLNPFKLDWPDWVKTVYPKWR